jgi:hypothetical protein
MENLDEQGKAILTLIVNSFDQIKPGDPRTYLGYKEIHDILKLDQVRENWGESLTEQGLSALADWTKNEGLPAITGLIVNQGDLEPGNGYFKLFERDHDYGWWQEEICKSLVFRWEPFLNDVSTLGDVVPIDFDVPERESIEVQRIIRNTTLAKKVKQLNDYECQICGKTIELGNGKRYVEAHHLQPLGKPHSGPDVQGNIICVCPNHHAMLDYGVIVLDENKLISNGLHRVDNRFIEYHNQNVWIGRVQ